MREITGIEDEIKGQVRYALADGTQIALKARDVEAHGLERCLAFMGFDIKPDPTPIPVYRDGEHVGTLPASHRPKSNSVMYQARPGDFVLKGDRWIADPALGNGDLIAAGVTVLPHIR